MKTFKYSNNNSHFWTLEDATFNPATGKVTGRCVDESIINRLFHCTSEQKGSDIGEIVSLPYTGHKISQWQFDQGFGEHSWCG